MIEKKNLQCLKRTNIKWLYEAITRTTNYAKNICEDLFFLTERYFSTFFMPCNHPPTTMRSYFQHIFLQPIFFFAVLSNINGGAPSDPCHFLKVTKTCEQPQVLAIVLPNSCQIKDFELMTSILRQTDRENSDEKTIMLPQ